MYNLVVKIFMHLTISIISVPDGNKSGTDTEKRNNQHQTYKQSNCGGSWYLRTTGKLLHKKCKYPRSRALISQYKY